MGSSPSAKMKKRANILILFAVTAFAAVITVNLFKLSAFKHDYYSKRAGDSQFQTEEINAVRGTIYTSDRKILAQSANVFTIAIDPVTYAKHDTKYQQELITFFRDELGIQESETLSAMNRQNTEYVVLATQVEMPEKEKLDAFLYNDQRNIRCIRSDQVTKRYYPQNSLAASVVGFTDSNGDGLYGVEASCDEYLSGVNGMAVSAYDAYGDQMPYRYSKLYAAKDGDSVNLTIDSKVQYYTESALESKVRFYNAAEGGCAIVMNAKTGEILSMASSESFDPNNRMELPEAVQKVISDLPEEKQQQAESDALADMWKNKAVSSAYEPGSVFKVFTASAGLEEKAAGFDSEYTCNGFYQLYDTRINCWCHSQGGHYDDNYNLINPLSFKDALAGSCNPAFMTIGLELGAERFSYYLDAFGLTERTGIDLPYEINSVTADTDQLERFPSDLANVAFGQNNIYTPMQIITGFAAVVNGGYLLRPYIVSSITDQDKNTVLRNSRNVRRQVISETTSALMREALSYVVESNPSGNVFIDGYRIGGKSGTAEKVAKYTEEMRIYEAQLEKKPDAVLEKPVQQNIAAYCCFAPADDPEVICLVMIDEPDQNIGVSGAKVAGQCAAEIMKNILPYLGYYPEYTEAEDSLRTITVPDVEYLECSEAEKIIEKAGFTCETAGTGTHVIRQVPSSAKSMALGGHIVLYTTADCEEIMIKMPDFSGKKRTEVLEEAEELGINIKITGSLSSSALAVEQSIVSGTKISKGSIVVVSFGSEDRTG